MTGPAAATHAVARAPVAPPAGPPAGSTPAHPASRGFAHASEAELARILDFYGVAWAYEPDTFPIGWNLDGDVVESFSPDFYLPELDLYLELTTLKQRLVRKKNRKLRRLRELYPGRAHQAVLRPRLPDAAAQVRANGAGHGADRHHRPGDPAASHAGVRSSCPCRLPSRAPDAADDGRRRSVVDVPGAPVPAFAGDATRAGTP